MGVIAGIGSNTLSGTQPTAFTGFKGFGSSTNAYDLSSPDGLLALAQSQGGAVADAANSLVHPTTGILSTIGAGFKNAFSDFVDIISMPSQVVAGSIDAVKNGKDLGASVSKAISKNTSVSDVIFGSQKKNMSTMEKIGSFLVRTAVDVLTDPLTYVTFGAGEGLLGLRAGSQISLGENAAKALGKQVLDTATLNSEGQAMYKYLRGIEGQMRGQTSAEIVRTGNSQLDMAGEELQKLLGSTIDSPLRPDFAKKAVANMLERNPALTETLLDKGGIKIFGKTILSGQRIAATAGVIPGMTMLDHVTRPVRQPLQALFDPSMVKVNGEYVRLPQEYMDLQQTAHDLANSLQDTRINKLVDIVKANELSQPEARYLTAAVEAGRMPVDERLATAYKQLLGFNNEEYEMLKQAGIAVNRLDNHVPHILVKNKIGGIPFSVPPSAKVGAAMHRTLEGPIFTTDAERLAKMETAVLKKQKSVYEPMFNDMKNTGFEGFDDNIITALTKRSSDNVRSSTMRYFMQDLAQNFGGDSALMEKWVPLKSSAVNGEAENLMSFLGKDGENLVYHPAIAEKVDNFVKAAKADDATGDLAKVYDSVQNFWKGSVTSIFPAFHGRNAISNVFLNMMDLGVHALNPRLHALAGDMVYKDYQLARLTRASMKGGEAGAKASEDLAKLLDTHYFTDATGHAWTFGELRQTAKDHNIAFTRSASVTSSDFALGPESLSKAIFETESKVQKAKNAVTTAAKFGQEHVGAGIENQARLLNFIANLRNTGDVTLAAKRTKQFLFDYNNLTNFERKVLRRIIPFYTFTRKNLELQVRALMTTPGRTAAQLTALGNLGTVLSGGQTLTDEEKAALPDWMKSGIGILTKKKGETVTMLSTLGTPIEAPFQALQFNTLLGSISPIVRLPVEQMSGYSFYQGKPLSEVTNAAAFKNAPKLLQDLIGFTALNGKRSDGTPFTWYTSLNPGMMNLVLNLPPTTRVFSALKQMNAVDVADQYKIMQQLIGIRPYTFDLVQEQQKRQKALADQLQTILTNAGVTAQFQTTYIPKAQKASFGSFK
jgi:hypothetical protein